MIGNRWSGCNYLKRQGGPSRYRSDVLVQTFMQILRNYYVSQRHCPCFENGSASGTIRHARTSVCWNADWCSISLRSCQTRGRRESRWQRNSKQNSQLVLISYFPIFVTEFDFNLCLRYLNNYVDNIFAGAWEPVEVSPLPVSIPLPSSSQG